MQTERNRDREGLTEDKRRLGELVFCTLSKRRTQRKRDKEQQTSTDRQINRDGGDDRSS